MNARQVGSMVKAFLGLVIVLALPAQAWADITSNLEVRLRMDEITGTSAGDSTGSGNTGTLTNGAAFTGKALFGNGVAFDGDANGANDYVSFTTSTSVDGASALTIAFWVNADLLDNNNRVMCSKYEDANNLISVFVSGPSQGGSDDIEVAINSTGTNGSVYTTGNVLSVRKWIHVTVVYNGSLSGNTNKCKIYINGQAASTLSSGTIPSSLHSDEGDPWKIGWRDSPASNSVFDGRIDEFHLFTRALSANDAAELYNWRPRGIWGCDFNGSDSKVEHTTASLMTGSTVTITAWVRAAEQGKGGTGQVVRLDESGQLWLQHDAVVNQYSFRADWSGATDGQWQFNATDGPWQCLQVTYNKGLTTNDPDIYVNGVQQNEQEVTSPSGSSPSVGLGYCIGNNSAQQYTWNGRIAHVQIHNRILSKAELDACRRAPGSVTDGLRLWLPLTHPNETKDYSGNVYDGTPTKLALGSAAPITDRLHHLGPWPLVSDQIIIGTSGLEPALGVVGRGTRTKLIPFAGFTSSQGFITSENWGTSGIVEPSVRNVYLHGAQGIPDLPYSGDEDGLPLVTSAIDIDGDAPQVIDNQIFDFRGSAICVRNSAAEASAQRRVGLVAGNFISHCWTGIENRAVDCHIANNSVGSCRDYGLRDNAGSVQSSGNHFFGMQTAIQFEGGPSRSVNDRFADAPIGFKITGGAGGSHIADGTTEHCWERNILVEASDIRVHNTRIRVANSSSQHSGIIGLDLTSYATASLVTDCDIDIGNYTFGGDTSIAGSTGVYVRAGNITIDNLKITGSTTSTTENEIGVRVAPNLYGGDFYIDARGGGFNQTGDRVVKFDSPGMGQIQGAGQVWYILYKAGDTPIEIPANWSGMRIFKRSHTQSDWIEIQTGAVQPE